VQACFAHIDHGELMPMQAGCGLAVNPQMNTGPTSPVQILAGVGESGNKNGIGGGRNKQNVTRRNCLASYRVETASAWLDRVIWLGRAKTGNKLTV
jgi:hypothetical protein